MITIVAVIHLQHDLLLLLMMLTKTIRVQTFVPVLFSLTQRAVVSCYFVSVIDYRQQTVCDLLTDFYLLFFVGTTFAPVN